MNQTKEQRQRQRIETELKRIAFANAADYLELVEDKDGDQRVRIKEPGRLRPAQRSALAMLKEGRAGVELQLKNPLKALELLCKLYGLFGSGGEEKDSGQLQTLMEGLRQLDSGQEEDGDDL